MMELGNGADVITHETLAETNPGTQIVDRISEGGIGGL
jgi:hypothetical protein